MSKLTNQNKKNRKELKQLENGQVVNFMNGISYKLNPLDTLKMISASSIFGEPSYYRDSLVSGKSYLSRYSPSYDWNKHSIVDTHKRTEELFIEAVNNSLDYDFKSTLDFAVELRKDYYMRLNPQVIMVLASIHPSRAEFNQKNPGYFSNIQKNVMQRGDEPASQLSFYLWYLKDKKHLPSILKRTWSKKLSSLSDYELNKYKNAHEGIIDTVRLSHAYSDGISKLMKDELVVDETDKTWNQLKSEGFNWFEIMEKTRIPYMALLKNLRGIGKEFYQLLNKDEVSRESLEEKWNYIANVIEKGVKSSKLFPYRFKVAYDMLSNESKVFEKEKMLSSIKIALNKSLENMDRLKGKTAILSDNSGSAWGTFNTEYGSVKVAEIGNLSAVITALNSDDGHVFTFGDKLLPVSKPEENDIISYAQRTNYIGRSVGMSTETGLFEFFRNAINNNEKWDNVFIYSDMQAGNDGCYDFKAYRDLNKLVEEYRDNVNPRVNIYSVQTAGYNNTVVPAYSPRQTLLYGWTGKEIQFASKMNDFWDNIEERSNKK